MGKPRVQCPTLARLFSLFLLCYAGETLGWSWRETLFGIPEPLEPPPVPWSYAGSTGPDRWASLSPKYAACGGQQQSPIELSGATPVGFVPLSFHYRSNPLHIINTGNQLLVHYQPGSYLIADHHRYELKEIHFHSPGEHAIRGVVADLELHLVHRDERGRFAVVAVPVRAGIRRNSTLRRISERLPPVDLQGYYERRRGINAVFLLPPRREYFRYLGSLTQPPCTEGAIWFVFDHPLEIDAGDLQRFRQVLGHNARPLQPRNGRQIFAFTHP